MEEVEKAEEDCLAANAGRRNAGGRVEARVNGALKTPPRSVLHVQCIVE